MSKKRKEQIAAAVAATVAPVEPAAAAVEVVAPVDVAAVGVVAPVEVQVDGQVAPVVEEKAAKVTKRSAMLTTTVLVATDKVPKNRAGHIVDAWAVVVAMLPATAAACIAEIDKLGQNPNGTNASYLTYWQQRGFLTAK